MPRLRDVTTGSTVEVDSELAKRLVASGSYESVDEKPAARRAAKKSDSK